ncbi:MAG: alpha/beta hydrolase [Actinomyces sp.]|nr:MAG: alpha/beta hydrolase [Actinomyces sp.]
MATLRYGDHPSQVVDLLEPRGPTDPDLPPVALLHGGYWRARWGRDLLVPLATRLAEAGRRVALVGYRRVGEVPVGWRPTFADVAEALERLAHLAPGTGADHPTRRRPVPVDVVGHSAGGQLALWATSAHPELVRRVVALAPVADLVEAHRRHLSRDAVVGLLGGTPAEVPDRYRASSPVELVPLGRPLLVVHGSADRDVPRALSRRLVEAAERAGDPVRALWPRGVDHFDLIDPDHPVSGEIVNWLAAPDPASGSTPRPRG